MSIRTSFRTKIAAAAFVVMAGSATLMTAQPAEASDALAAGIIGGFVGATLFPPVYPAPVYPAPAYPVYAAPPVIYQPAPVVVYEEPVYVEPVYPAPVYSARPAYSGPSGYRPAYQQRRSLAEVETYDAPRHERPGSGPRVVTYDDTVGGTRIAGAEPWSPAWYDYCRSKFRSFDERSGTFLGYDGQRHFCTVK